MKHTMVVIYNVLVLKGGSTKLEFEHVPVLKEGGTNVEQ